MKNFPHKKYWFVFLIILVSSVTAQTRSNLLFKSSFNQNVIVDKTVIWNHHLNGTDMETNFTFPDDLPGDTVEHYFNYVVGDLDNYFEYANAEVLETIGYDDNLTNALYIEFIKDDPAFVSYSRVQYVLFGDILSDDPVQRMNKGYVKYRIKTHLDHNDEESDWRLPIEWKDMDDDGFRMGLYIYDTNTETPYWVVKGQYMIDGELGEDVWQVDNHDIAVLEDDWFELEVYWYGHPDPTLGKLKVAINGEILFDVTNQTKDPNKPDKMFYFMPFKVYGAVGYSWITDFEYWNEPPLTSVLANTSLSENDETLALNTSIYPNPNNNVINFSVDYTDMNYLVTDLTGQVVTKGIIKNNRVDITKLTIGVYFIKVLDNKHNTQLIKKLIKN